ncbi:MAG: FHA domain-containing protein [Micropruina glycogenica]
MQGADGEQQITIEDLGSTNGIVINGHRCGTPPSVRAAASRSAPPAS